jgi:hypothetical protein
LSRYEKAELEKKIEAAGFEIQTTLWMNALGIAGWFVNALMFKRQTIPVAQGDAFEHLVPVARLVYALPRGLSLMRLVDRFATAVLGGLSLICVARRPA